ncbi:MAG TPA: hypothetical protein VFA75_07680 [Nevskia sp.]|nr:hypothetical protein [Nevskia sp.]
MDTVEWIARSPCWLASALRGFANYGLSLSGMPGVVPVVVAPVAPARPAAARRAPPDRAAGEP